MQAKQGYFIVLLFSGAIGFGLYKLKDSGLWLMAIVGAILLLGLVSGLANIFLKK
ncbi:hypothetical protein KJ885_04565 [Patescibacteria group bacterium]|nr:hypothetical protein [Patescibacteria group bacterium]